MKHSTPTVALVFEQCLFSHFSKVRLFPVQICCRIIFHPQKEHAVLSHQFHLLAFRKHECAATSPRIRTMCVWCENSEHFFYVHTSETVLYIFGRIELLTCNFSHYVFQYSCYKYDWSLLLKLPNLLHRWSLLFRPCNFRRKKMFFFLFLTVFIADARFSLENVLDR